MHDFGEYMPFDAKLSDNSDPFEYHTKYVEDWALIAKETLEELGLNQEVFYFMRAGTTRSPSMTSVFWMGDQLPTFDRQDGLHSALIG
jgi:alpha-glucosidase